MATEMAPQVISPRGVDQQVPASGETLAVSNLAALLDRFTQSVTDPGAHTVGEFAGTVQALHGELAMLARQFGAVDGQPLEAYSFDEVFPDAALANELAIEPGIAASEELEHRCRQLSR